MTTLFVLWAHIRANCHGLLSTWASIRGPLVHQTVTYYDDRDETLLVACTCGKAFYIRKNLHEKR